MSSTNQIKCMFIHFYPHKKKLNQLKTKTWVDNINHRLKYILVYDINDNYIILVGVFQI